MVIKVNQGGAALLHLKHFAEGVKRLRTVLQVPQWIPESDLVRPLEISGSLYVKTYLHPSRKGGARHHESSQTANHRLHICQGEVAHHQVATVDRVPEALPRTPVENPRLTQLQRAEYKIEHPLLPRTVGIQGVDDPHQIQSQA